LVDIIYIKLVCRTKKGDSEFALTKFRRKVKMMHIGTVGRRPFLNILLIAASLFPALSLADAERIFRENSNTVVVVETFAGEGYSLNQGSGFIVRADGAVVTSYHVISNAEDIKVKVGDKVLEVEGLINSDKEKDLVILKVKGENLPTVRLGDIEKENIGEKVYVISSPKGLENTISDGILSGIREISPWKKILQITAPVSPGSSGGPVFNDRGEVIGVATLIIKEAQNINFAMPVNLIADKISGKKITGLKDSKIEDVDEMAEYWFNLGVTHGDVGIYKVAIDAFKKAIKIKPDFAEAHFNLGIAFGNVSMTREAIGEFKQAIKIRPDDAEAHYNIGVAYINAGMGKEAIEAFKQALRIRPGFAQAHYNLGVSYLTNGNREVAVEEYKILKDLDPASASKLFDLIYK